MATMTLLNSGLPAGLSADDLDATFHNVDVLNVGERRLRRTSGRRRWHRPPHYPWDAKYHWTLISFRSSNSDVTQKSNRKVILREIYVLVVAGYEDRVADIVPIASSYDN
ncbi:uncharacterized protein HKW66_Vig0215920 [Vigna angularis]|uniref:Uncharacterized protein n=1 Tax=Phaseolus angularis TaxID=3914 RepID=A0A8T0JFC4_PHAAN|nr:uncharacterized protein HKW66_Vig0215920 [Vigna angularis]